MRNVTLTVLMLLVAACWCDEGDDDQVDAGDVVDAGVADAGADAQACGATWGVCCPNDAPERCNPEALCNASGICEAMCFPFCSDGGQ